MPIEHPPIEHPILLIRHAIPGMRWRNYDATTTIEIGREELLETSAADGRISLFSDPGLARPPWLICVRFKKQLWIQLIGSDPNLIPIEDVGSIDLLHVLATWFEPDTNLTQVRFYKEGTLEAELTADGKDDDALNVQAFQSSAHPKTLLDGAKTVRQAVEAFFAPLKAQPRELTAVIDGLHAQLTMHDAAGKKIDPKTVDELSLKYYAPLTDEENPASVALEAAIRARNLKGVRKAIADSASLEFLPNTSDSPMDLALEHWHEEGGWPIVTALLKAGAPLQSQWQGPRTFGLITTWAYEPHSVATMKKLVELGADINAPSPGDMRDTALHRAISLNLPEIVRFLLQNGASLTARDFQGKTPVERANELKKSGSYRPSVLSSPADATDFAPGPFPRPKPTRNELKESEDIELESKRRVVRVVALVEQAVKERREG